MLHDRFPKGRLAATAMIILVGASRSQAESVPQFIRGDASRNARVDLADAIAVLQGLFSQSGLLTCGDAADADDSGSVEITDAIKVLGFLFLGHAPPAPPFPAAGADPSPDALDCADFDPRPELEPPRPLAPAEAEVELEGNDGQSISFIDGGVPVTPAAFEALGAIPPGQSLLDWIDVPGMHEFIEALSRRMPPAGSPIAIPDQLTAPAGADGCYPIDARKLKGQSRDTGSGATGADDLRFSVSPEVVCGAGSHVVDLTVTDEAGLSSTASTQVMLCPPEEPDCTEVISSLGPGTEGPPQGLMCVWVVSVSSFPVIELASTRGVTFDENGRVQSVKSTSPILIGSSPTELTYSASGPGPTHKLLALRSLPRCTTPQSELALLGWGSTIIRLNVLCYNPNDCTVALLETCKGVADVEGSYVGSIRVFTEATTHCDGLTDLVEGLAQEEAQLRANDSELFRKALAVQVGNSISRKVIFNLTGTVGVNRRGAAADLSIVQGYTHEVWGHAGRRVGNLRAFGGARFPLPLTAQLASEGKAELFASKKANGLAAAVTEVAAIYAFGLSNCPGAGTVCVVSIRGRKEALDHAILQAEDFFFQRTGKRPDVRERVLGR